MGVVLVVLLLVAVGAIALLLNAPRTSKEQQLLDGLHRTDATIASDYQQARRDMNDAASQSWRNLAE